MVWIDRFVPPTLLHNRTQALRARVVVGACFFAVVASLIVQGIRLQQEVQHWIPLAAWTFCTFIFIVTPLILRATGQLWFCSALTPIAMLIGSLGVAVMEGGVTSPNVMVMIIAPMVGTLLGGWRSGVAAELFVVASSGAFWVAHEHGLLPAESPLDERAVMVMRAALLAALSTTAFVLTMFYELERDRAETELAERASEIARAREVETKAAETRIELLAAQGRELERDLQLTAAVQKLLLPKTDRLETEFLTVAGFSVTAAQAGGDWWFSEPLADGGVRVVLGDVTGHGAAPAMVAAVVAGAFRALQEAATLPPRALLDVLNEVSRDVSAGMYTMPFGLLDIDAHGTARWLSAAAPPVLVLRRGGAVDSYTVPGTPLGSTGFKVGERSFELAPGDRVLLTSDGVSELRLESGYDLGLRRLTKLLRDTEEVALHEARDEIAERLDKMRGREVLYDDVTFALIELRSRKARRSLA